MVIGVLLVAALALAPEVKAPAVITPKTGSQELRLFIAQCEQQGGMAVVTVNKRDALAMGCIRASWETVEMPE